MNPVTEYLALEVGALHRRMELMEQEHDQECEEKEEVIRVLMRERVEQTRIIQQHEANVHRLTQELVKARILNDGYERRLENTRRCIETYRHALDVVRRTENGRTVFTRPDPPAENRPPRRMPQTIARVVRRRLEGDESTTETEVSETELEDN